MQTDPLPNLALTFPAAIAAIQRRDDQVRPGTWLSRRGISLRGLSASGTGDAAAFSTLRKELSLLDAVAVAATWIGLFVRHCLPCRNSQKSALLDDAPRLRVNYLDSEI
jgi:hypothetical protein